MCGRYVIFSTPEAIRALFRYGEQPNFPPRYNIAPTQPIPIVRLVDGKPSFALMRWGLLPSWVEEPISYPVIVVVIRYLWAFPALCCSHVALIAPAIRCYCCDPGQSGSHLLALWWLRLRCRAFRWGLRVNIPIGLRGPPSWPRLRNRYCSIGGQHLLDPWPT
jgi:hypothetical protein